jgi:para-nitrobenzyl esterase
MGAAPRIALRCVVALIALGACGAPEAPSPGPDPVTERELASGRIVGFANDDGAHVWRGVPFAKPPVGELRWRAPRPPESWQGTRDATRFGNACPQFGGLIARFSGEGDPTDVIGSEDCLVANVFAPPFAPGDVPRGDARLPVMVWIHGGGNSIGSAEIYELGRLARSEQVVVVALQYRLGVLGWFRHPALHEEGESADDRSGNYGTLDLIRGLEWVRENASAFGGDPDRVIVFGESAGGINVYSLLISPRARGLFQGAIVQSGALWSSSVDEAVNLSDAPVPGHPQSSSEVLLSVLQRRGAEDRAAAVREAAVLSPDRIGALLRGASLEEIFSPFDAKERAGMYRGPFLVRDGHVLPEAPPLAVFEAGAHQRVPVILGSNRDETKLFLLFSDDSVTRLFGFPLWLSDARRYDLLAEYQSRMWKETGVDEPAQAMSRYGDVFVYRFDWDEEPRVLFADYGRLLGAAHAMELFFVLGHLDVGRANRFLFDEARRPAAEALSAAMMSYWGRFAHGAAPDRGRAGDLPRWQPWLPTPAGARFLVFDTEAGGGVRMAEDVADREDLFGEVARDPRFATTRERCEVYAGFVGWDESLSEERYAEVADGACADIPPGEFESAP